ncbi:MAG: hypothetical protein NVS1B6_00700 [Steroidobacteraceae bacterium]
MHKPLMNFDQNIPRRARRDAQHARYFVDELFFGALATGELVETFLHLQIDGDRSLGGTFGADGGGNFIHR